MKIIKEGITNFNNLKDPKAVLDPIQADTIEVSKKDEEKVKNVAKEIKGAEVTDQGAIVMRNDIKEPKEVKSADLKKMHLEESLFEDFDSNMTKILGDFKNALSDLVSHYLNLVGFESGYEMPSMNEAEITEDIKLLVNTFRDILHDYTSYTGHDLELGESLLEDLTNHIVQVSFDAEAPEEGLDLKAIRNCLENTLGMTILGIDTTASWKDQDHYERNDQSFEVDECCGDDMLESTEEEHNAEVKAVATNDKFDADKYGEYFDVVDGKPVLNPDKEDAYFKAKKEDPDLVESKKEDLFDTVYDRLVSGKKKERYEDDQLGSYISDDGVEGIKVVVDDPSKLDKAKKIASDFGLRTIENDKKVFAVDKEDAGTDDNGDPIVKNKLVKNNEYSLIIVTNDVKEELLTTQQKLDQQKTQSQAGVNEPSITKQESDAAEKTRQDAYNRAKQSNFEDKDALAALEKELNIKD